MNETTFFRGVSLAIIMLVVGIGWFFIKSGSSKENQEESRSKNQAKKQAIKYSVIIGVIYMVVLMGAANI